MKNFAVLIFALLLATGAASLSSARNEHARGLEYEPPERLSGIPRFSARPAFAGGALPAAIDYASHLPPVGEQGMMPSCVSWAVGYYYKCFQENRDENWAREQGGWDNDELCSPAFLYNQVNNGSISGTYAIDNLNVITRMGIVSWNDMPYSNNPFKWYSIFGIKFRNLPSKQNYYDAARYRGDSYSAVFTDNPGDAEVAAIKSVLAGGELVVFGMDTGGGDFDDFDGAGHCLDSQVYSGSAHAMVIVGYDDKFDGAAHGCPGAGSGAFHAVNSWGADWGGNGYFWITYKGAKNNMKYGYTMTDRQDYTPTVMAELDIRHARRGYLDVVFHAGTDTENFLGDSLKELVDGERDARSDISVWVDLTDFDKAGRYPPDDSDNKWTVYVANGDASNSGTIEKFGIVRNGVSTDSENTPVTLAPGGSGSAAIQPVSAAAARPVIHKGWNLLGVSAQGAEINLDDFKRDGVKLYSFDGQYDAIDGNGKIALAPGEGCWFYSKNELGEIDAGGTIIREAEYGLVLKPGWNLFSSPFSETIEWAGAHASLACGGKAAELPPVYYYSPEKGYVKIAPGEGISLQPWQGCLINVKDDCELTLTK